MENLKEGLELVLRLLVSALALGAGLGLAAGSATKVACLIVGCK